EVDPPVDGVLLDVRQQVGGGGEVVLVAAGRQDVGGAVVVVRGEGELLEVVGRLRAGGGELRLADRRQHQPQQQRQQGQRGEQLVQRERAAARGGVCGHGRSPPAN